VAVPLLVLTLWGRRSTFVTKIRMPKQLVILRLLKPHNIGHLKGIETSFQVVPLFFKYFQFCASYITFWNFLKIPSVFKGLISVSFRKLDCGSK
jgi:hypothetical protein